VNLVGPTPATSDRITGYLADRLHRWYDLAVPEWAITLALQDAGAGLVLSSQRISPNKLLDDGFEFRDATAEQAVDALLSL
jgi:NAD dependent epimerase/dehydratase family enzyme